MCMHDGLHAYNVGNDAGQEKTLLVFVRALLQSTSAVCFHHKIPRKIRVPLRSDLLNHLLVVHIPYETINKRSRVPALKPRRPFRISAAAENLLSDESPPYF